MQTQSILLVEDDFLNRRLSKKVLSENGYHILEAKNTKAAFDILNKEEVALAIVDINLGEGEQDGISLGQALHQRYAIPFIYLTAYDTAEIVSRAVATTPHTYITKPFKNVELLTSVALAIRHVLHKDQRRPSVLVKDNEYNVGLPLDEIDYIEAEGNYLLFHTAHKCYKNRSTIRQILEILPKNNFIQTHRAFVVNKTRIEKFNIRNLVVKDRTIPVSRHYIDDITAIFG